MGQALPPQKNILELNPKHPVIEKINSLYQKDKNSTEVKNYIGLIYDQALLTAGFKLKDPLNFSKKLTELITKVVS
jgi:molecular chaperone HtpG